VIWKRDPLVDPAFERRTKKAVREALRANPTERRRARTLRKGATTNGRISQFGYGMLALFGLWGCLQAPGLNETGRLGMLTVVAFCLALVRRQSLLSELHASPSLFAMSLWPVSVETAFERQSSLGLHRRWTCDVLTIGICFVLVRDWELGVFDGVGVLACALVLRAVSQSLAALLALSSRGLLLGHVGLGFFVVQLFIRNLPGVSASLNAFWNSSGETVSRVLPTGWVLRVFRGFLEGRALSEAIWILPASGLLWAMPWALRRLRASYEFRDAVLLHYAAETPKAWNEEARAAHESTLVNVPTTASPDLLARLESREFLTPQIETSSFLDRLWLRWLTDRERTVLEWAQEGPLRLGRKLAWSMGLGALAVIASYVVCRGEPGHDAGWFIAAGTAFAMPWVVRNGIMGRVFQPIPNMALQSPRIAFVPVTLAEIVAILLKFTMVMVPLWVPLMMAVGGCLGWTMGRETWEFARIGLALGLALPGFVLLHLMAPAAGPGPLRWRSSLVGLALMGPPVFMFLGCLAVVVFWHSPWTAAVAVVGDLLMLVAFVAFRWIHQRRLFDLVGPIQS
jgi:hypothetical protein